MNGRAALSIALIAAGVGASVLAAAGDDADPPARELAPARRPGPAALSDLASPEELKLWTARGCVTCHGPEARGGPMAPDLTKVIPLYVAKFGSEDAARAAIAAYLLDPADSPKLRDDGEAYPNPMPPLERLFGGRREEAPVLAAMLLRLAR